MYDLLYAAAVGDCATTQRCIDRSKKAAFWWGDLTRTCGRCRNALHYAALGGHTHIAQCLLDAGMFSPPPAHSCISTCSRELTQVHVTLVAHAECTLRVVRHRTGLKSLCLAVLQARTSTRKMLIAALQRTWPHATATSTHSDYCLPSVPDRGSARASASRQCTRPQPMAMWLV